MIKLTNYLFMCLSLPQVTVISIVLIFAFIAGTVANGIQVESATSLHTDRCTFQFQDIEVCQDLGTLISCQLACAVS